MAERDKDLPRLPTEALHGVFAKTHLVTLMQKYLQGGYPDLQTLVESQPPTQTQEWREALSQGLFMEVFDYTDVKNHPEEFKALMASDNMSHGTGATDSEIRVIREIRGHIKNLPLGTAATKYEAVLNEVQRLSGQRWELQDLQHFWNFAQTTWETVLALLFEAWLYGKCEDVMFVDAEFYGSVAKNHPGKQWTRAALCVMQFLSDPDKEQCERVGGRNLARAVEKKDLKKLLSTTRTEEQKAASDDMEAFMSSMMDVYYFPWADDWRKSPYRQHSSTPGLVRFLHKMSSYVI